MLGRNARGRPSGTAAGGGEDGRGAANGTLEPCLENAMQQILKRRCRQACAKSRYSDVCAIEASEASADLVRLALQPD